MRFLAHLVLFSFLSIAGLVSCQHDEAGQAPARRKENTIGPGTTFGQITPREDAEWDVVDDVLFARGIELGDISEFKPEDSISVYINKKKHRFANVHQFRLNIRHRWDSLTAVGAKLDFDTTARPFK